MSQAQDVEIAAHNSQVEDDNRTNCWTTHFIIRMKHSPLERFGQMEYLEHLYKRY